VSRDYEHVEFRPWYVPDTAGWLTLSLAARGLVAELLRKFDQRGQLRIRQLEDLCILLRLSWSEVEPAIRELIAANRLGWDKTAGVLFDPDFVDRMRRGSAARMARKRQKDSAANDDADIGTSSAIHRRSDVTPVTARDGCDARGAKGPCDVTSDLISSDLISEKIPEEIPSARARAKPDPTAAPPDWWAGVLETVAMNAEPIPAGESWLRYAGHRAGKSLPATREDALYWLTTVMVPEARDRREKAAERQAREAKWDRQRAGPGTTTEPLVDTPEEQAARAERLRRSAAERKAARERGAA